MSVKGFPTSQKVVADVTKSGNEFATVQPAHDLRHALDTVTRFAFRVGSATVPRTAGAGTGTPADRGPTVITDTSTPAKVGDFVRFEDGNAQYLELPVIEVPDANTIRVASRLPSGLAPASGDEFYIMRYATQRVADDGSQIVVLTVQNAEPIDFDGIAAQSITTSAYTQVTASLADDATEIEVNNTTGKTLILAVGGSGSEVDTMLIPPGGIQRQPVSIPSGSRVSVKAKSANTAVGEVNINYFG